MGGNGQCRFCPKIMLGRPRNSFQVVCMSGIGFFSNNALKIFEKLIWVLLPGQSNWLVQRQMDRQLHHLKSFGCFQALSYCQQASPRSYATYWGYTNIFAEIGLTRHPQCHFLISKCNSNLWRQVMKYTLCSSAQRALTLHETEWHCQLGYTSRYSGTRKFDYFPNLLNWTNLGFIFKKCLFQSNLLSVCIPIMLLNIPFFSELCELNIQAKL